MKVKQVHWGSSIKLHFVHTIFSNLCTRPGMEKEAEQDPSMWCDEWFAAVCAVTHEREVENVTEYSRERHWDSDQMCR